MKIAALLRVRNEELIIEDALRHFSAFCDEIHVLDDDSEDSTVEICQQWPKVVEVLCRHDHDELVQTHVWETVQRAMLLKHAKRRSDCEWFLCIDADERVEAAGTLKERLESHAETKELSGLRFRLLDGYMTGECCDKYRDGYLVSLDRRWGIERRDILCLFRRDRAVGFSTREPMLEGGRIVTSDVWIRHFGKCIGVERWERLVDRHQRRPSVQQEKWRTRRGKAVHCDASDFCTRLYDWDTAKARSYMIWPERYSPPKGELT